MTVYIPLTRAEIMLPPADRLRAIMAAKYETAKDTPPREKVRRIVKVIDTSPEVAQQVQRAHLRAWHPLPPTQRRAHDSIHRCGTCGQWVCAEKYQRVPHTCCARKEAAA